MLSLYPVVGHALLSAQAKALNATEGNELDQWSLLAEELLGFTGTTFDTGQANRARRAIARQVSVMLERGVEASVYSSYTQGSLTFAFRRDAGLLDEYAAEIAAVLLAEVSEEEPVSAPPPLSSSSTPLVFLP